MIYLLVNSDCLNCLIGYKIQIQLKDYLFCKRNCFAKFVLPDKKIALENCLYINKYFNKYLPKIFQNWFTLLSGFHTYNVSSSNSGCIVAPPHNTKLYGKNSVNISAVNYHQVSL